jgi:hypothetical protein
LGVYCDRSACGTLKDSVVGRWSIVDPVARRNETTEDFAGSLRVVVNGPLSVVKECRTFARVGLSQVGVYSDDQESGRLTRRRNGRPRGDVGACAMHSRGALTRLLPRGGPRQWLWYALAG